MTNIFPSMTRPMVAGVLPSSFPCTCARSRHEFTRRVAVLGRSLVLPSLTPRGKARRHQVAGYLCLGTTRRPATPAGQLLAAVASPQSQARYAAGGHGPSTKLNVLTVQRDASSLLDVVPRITRGPEGKLSESIRRTSGNCVDE